MIAQWIGVLMSSVRQGLKGLIPIFLLLLYTFIGAAIFYFIEGPNEISELEQLKRERSQLLESTVFRLNNIRAMKPINAYNHTVHTLKLYRDKLGVSEVDVEDVKWSWWGAVFYALTVYTTIGYGNITPVTTAGRAVTIIYALIGIPLAVISLIALGSLFARACRFLWKLILKSLEKSTAVVSKDLEKQVVKLDEKTNGTKEDEDDKGDLLSFPISFLLAITLLWVLVCAAIFLLIEDQWNYGTSLYFTLISFTTIGFGDVLPSKPNYMLLVGFCLLIGLALLSTVFNIIQQQIEALGDGIDSDIDKQYNEALSTAYDEGAISISEEDAKMMADHQTSYDQTASLLENARQPKLDAMKIDEAVAKMPLKSRLLYHCMSQRRKDRLTEKAQSRVNVRVVGTQTDAQLLRSLVDRFTSDDDVTLLVMHDGSFRTKRGPHCAVMNDLQLEMPDI